MILQNADYKHMTEALKLAGQAFLRNEVPVGAVVVDRAGKVLARASNRTEQLGCQAGHAEVQAIKKACRRLKDWRLEGCWLFVTLQPCMMCFGLASLSRMAGIYYGADSNIFGMNMEPSSMPLVYQNLVIIPGLKKLECTAILTQCFVKSRKTPHLGEKKNEKRINGKHKR